MRERVGHGEVGRRVIGGSGVERAGGSADRRFGPWLPGERPAEEWPAAEWPAEEWPAAGWSAGDGSVGEWPTGERLVGLPHVRRSPGGGATRPARPRGWRIAQRRGPGPRPVRPGAVVVAARPTEAPRPSGPATRYPALWAVGPRVLGRSGSCAARPSRLRLRIGLRRAVAGVALVVASAAVVVVLGLLAGVGEVGTPAGAPGVTSLAPPAPVVVTVEPGETVWEVAARVAPGLSGEERAALAERIVTENQLASARLEPGRVLRVVVG